MTLTYGKLLARFPLVTRANGQSLCLHHSSQLRPLAIRRVPAGSVSNVVLRRNYADHRRLDLVALDRKWRERWAAEKNTAEAVGSNPGRNGSVSTQPEPDTYILPMFPYPSGHLHLGHLRVYAITDALARFRTLQGSKVMLPMGWDSFGLPAENAAIERGIDPAKWTKDNIARMKEQLEAMNSSWDWSREISTCDPEFYKHTQRIFLHLHEQGLAYRAEAEVNYDPVDKTVLANEQVDTNGFSWRSGAKVEKRRLRQWFFKISEFRESLLQDLDVLAKDEAWPERVLMQQRHWLGKSTGALVKFPVLAGGSDVHRAVEVFTTRPDTLFGVQYLALASTHPVVLHLAKKDPELQAFLDTLPGLPPDSKVGYLLPELRAVNPLAYHEDTPGATKASIPIYVAPYVVADYGEGAVMGVPGHDTRDHAFWQTHRSEDPVRVVLAASEDESTTAFLNEPFLDHGVMTAAGGPFRGKPSREAGGTIVRMLEQAGLAKEVEKWRLRDWLVSRQRYWGAPIPIIHCKSCGDVPVPEDQLPVELPQVDGHWAERKPGNPLETAEDWVKTTCPKCDGPARRDTDTMDTFVDSSWYYMRFIDPHNSAEPFSVDKAKNLLPVDLYIGGVEHAILHLLYARFVYKFLMSSSNLAVKGSGAVHEPFKRLITQGMVHGKTLTDPNTGRFLKPGEYDLTNPARPLVKATGEPALITYEKMSKSKHNGVDPTEIIAQYGADATRAHMLFQAPVGDVLNWDEKKISGVTRWLGKLYEAVQRLEGSTSSAEISPREYLEKTKGEPSWDADVAIWRHVQQTIPSVTTSYERVYSLNTVVSDLMGLTNTIVANRDSASETIQAAAASALLRMVAPITPAFADECWSILHSSSTGSIFAGPRFPETDGSLDALQPSVQKCAVQVNGKLAFLTQIPQLPETLKNDKKGLDEWIVKQILGSENVEVREKLARWPNLATGRAIVIKGGKLVNFVLRK